MASLSLTGALLCADTGVCRMRMSGLTSRDMQKQLGLLICRSLYVCMYGHCPLF